jgi:transcriptional regulator of nitric oxide reductase
MAVRAFSLLDSYAYGYAIQEKNLPGASTARDATDQFLSELPAEGFPNLMEVALHAAKSGIDLDTEFAFGLDLILDALDRMLAAGPGRKRRR